MLTKIIKPYPYHWNKRRANFWIYKWDDERKMGASPVPGKVFFNSKDATAEVIRLNAIYHNSNTYAASYE